MLLLLWKVYTYLASSVGINRGGWISVLCCVSVWLILLCGNILLYNTFCFQVEEFLHHPEVLETNRYFVRKYLEYLENQVTVECSKGIHPLLQKPQCVYSIDFNPNATPSEELLQRKDHENSCCRLWWPSEISKKGGPLFVFVLHLCHFHSFIIIIHCNH